MTPSISPINAAADAGKQFSNTTAVKTKDTDKNMFLQLLVAQLRNQDPMNPKDGTEFVAQLAQFQQLEQSINTGQDVAAIRSSLEQFMRPTAAPGSNS